MSQSIYYLNFIVYSLFFKFLITKRNKFVLQEIEHIYKFNKFTPDENLTACNKDVAKKIDDNSLTSLKVMLIILLLGF